jgi:NADH:ubiquinone oxidoreductase subunit 6 (subunit J)
MINKGFNLLIALLLFSVLFIALDDSYTDLAKKEEINYISIEQIAGGPDIRGGIFSDFIFSFELLSLLLLAALIGALYIAKKEA